MGDGMLALVFVFCVASVIAFCYAYWRNSDGRKESRERLEDYRNRYHYQDGGW
jgi:hypothetical protein